MLESIKRKFPVWCGDESEDFDLILSDDIDSLMCAIYQKVNFNRDVKYFFNANTENNTQKNYKVKDYERKENRGLIALDIALEGGKCWDNHVLKVEQNDKINTNSANLNVALNIRSSNYTDKAVVSSFITMLSYYDFDLKRLTKDQLMVICAIDGLYYPFKTKFKATARRNLRYLGYEFLADFITENIDEIIYLEGLLNLKKGKIWVDDEGYLTTDIDLKEISKIFGFEIALPKEQYQELKTFKKTVSDGTRYRRCSLNKNQLIENLESEGYTLFNFALTYRNTYICSYF